MLPSAVPANKENKLINQHHISYTIAWNSILLSPFPLNQAYLHYTPRPPFSNLMLDSFYLFFNLILRMTNAFYMMLDSSTSH